MDPWYFSLAASIQLAESHGVNTQNWQRPPDMFYRMLEQDANMRLRLDNILRAAGMAHPSTRSQPVESVVDLPKDGEEVERLSALLMLGVGMEKDRIQKSLPIKGRPMPNMKSTLEWVKDMFIDMVAGADNDGGVENPAAIDALANFLSDLRAEFLIDPQGADESGTITAGSIARNNAAVYQRLEEGQDLRLLYLYPAHNRNDAIQCDLVPASFQNIAEYEALSYTWGLHIGSRCSLFLNNTSPEVVQITSNLDCALKDLRFKDRVRILWVDAICINQSHNGEKSIQIQQMRRIYSQASRVLVWLGPEKERAFEALQLLSNLPEILESLSNQPDEDFAKKTQSLATISHSAWWSRIWCLQEIVVAKKASFYIGRYSIDWDEVSLAYQGWAKAMLQFGPGFIEYFDLSSKLWHQLSIITQLREQMLPPILLEMLVFHGELEATDPRDQLYALLGLVETSDPCHSDPSLKPDYSIRLSELWTRVALHLIKRHGIDVISLATLGVAAQSGIRKHERIMFYLPSWAPDWRAVSFSTYAYFAFTNLLHSGDPVHRIMSRMTGPWKDATGMTRFENAEGYSSEHNTIPNPSLFRASKGLQAVPMRIVDRQSWGANSKIMNIICSGFSLDVIEAVAPQQRTTGATATAKADEFIQLLGPEWAADNMYIHKQTQTLGEAVIRTLLADQWPNEVDDRNAGFHRLPPKLPTSMHDSEASTDSFTQNVGLLSQNHLSERIARGRRLFRSKTGYIGLAPPLAEKGHHVVIFSGASIPFVIHRPHFWDQGRYTFIGDCYVHGIMDGEAVARRSERDILEEYQIE
ncbi:heterokaryon incompatibility protein-domain-containing protein [Annulohypoxylon nitens]|nr:heterokaryon incompatibility protein-domain-containing protein [Annulohypoxylon nitens]